MKNILFILTILIGFWGCKNRKSTGPFDDNNDNIESKKSTWTPDLNSVVWQAKDAHWIGGKTQFIRKQFQLDKNITMMNKVNIHVTAHGYFELHINGQKIGNTVLNPDFTNYDSSARYLTYDITNTITEQNNVIGLILGDAYFGREHWAIVQLDITYNDGSMQTINSDSSWKALANGPFLDHYPKIASISKYNTIGSVDQLSKLNIYSGEIYDSRLYPQNWDSVNFNDNAWSFVLTNEERKSKVTLIPQESFIKVIEEINPVTITEIDSDSYLIDFGKNIAGWVQIKVSADSGQEIKIQYAENINSKNELELFSNRSAKAQDIYIANGKTEQIWEPKFVYHGFRYVRVDNFPHKMDKDDIIAKFLSTDAKVIGSWNSSSTLLNKMHEMVKLGLRGNLMSIPTDCPQRDERQGWLGDALMYSIPSMYTYDVKLFWEKWFQDVSDAQRTTGTFPSTAPSYLIPYKSQYNDVPWMSASVLIPYYHYLYFGDIKILKRHYPGMQKFIQYLTKYLDSNYTFIQTPFSHKLSLYTDWSSLDNTSRPFLSSSFFFHIIKTMEKISIILKKKQDESDYKNLALKVQKGFNQHFLKRKNTEMYYIPDVQSSQAIAINFEIVPEHAKKSVLNHLIKLINKNDNHLTTGVLGSFSLLQALSKNDRNDVALKLALQTTYPGWGYIANKKNQTTFWETWPDIRNTPASSRNHPYLGAPLDHWLHNSIIGLRPTKAGFTSMEIRPFIPILMKEKEVLSHASYQYNSIQGLIKIKWQIIDDKTFSLKIVIPKNSEAKVFIPHFGLEFESLLLDDHDQFPDHYNIEYYNNERVFTLPEGIYDIKAQLKKS